MRSVLIFKELENQVISAAYRNLMIGAKVVLVDVNGIELSEPVASITSPAPNGTVRIRLPAVFKPGTYYLRALNGHGAGVAESMAFSIG